MKKLIITMIAIAFSLSAFSETTHIEYIEEHGVNVLCISDLVFFGSPSVGYRGLSTPRWFMQVLNEKGLPMKCSEYKK